MAAMFACGRERVKVEKKCILAASFGLGYRFIELSQSSEGFRKIGGGKFTNTKPKTVDKKQRH